jgi:hypothetical protein
MKKILINFFFLIGVAGILLSMVALIVFGNQLVDKNTPRLYNCSIAEISPDFTHAMREECRKQRKLTT